MKNKQLISFVVKGKRIPVDHGFLLYAAISSILPEFHETKDIGVRLIRGAYDENGYLNISPESYLRLLVPQELLSTFLALCGRELNLVGNRLTVGVARTFQLKPVSTLYAHLVTTRNGNDQDRFQSEISRQMQEMEIQCSWKVGKRRTFKVHGKQVVGYSILAHGLDAASSLRLQEQGLGGRRKMGCGMFEEFK